MCTCSAARQDAGLPTVGFHKGWPVRGLHIEYAPRVPSGEPKFKGLKLSERPRTRSAVSHRTRIPMSSIEQQVKSIVAEQLGVKEEEVTSDASFVDDLGADSL